MATHLAALPHNLSTGALHIPLYAERLEESVHQPLQLSPDAPRSPTRGRHLFVDVETPSAAKAIIEEVLLTEQVSTVRLTERGISSSCEAIFHACR